MKKLLNLLKQTSLTATPLAKLQTSFTYAIACYKVGDTEKAKEIFENIVDTAPHLNFSKLAEKYLADINGLEKLNY